MPHIRTVREPTITCPLQCTIISTVKHSVNAQDVSPDSVCIMGVPQHECCCLMLSACSTEGLTKQQPGTDIHSQSRSGSSPQYTSPALASQDYQSEEEIDNKFLELERQTLESMMQASRLDSQQDSGTHEQSQQHLSSGSATSSSSSEAESASHSGSSNTSGSNWWHSASSHLQQVQQRTGPLESHQAHEMAKDVTTLLTRIINARVMRGLDPTATQLVDLAVFQVGVAASADPAVRIAPPRTDFSINIRQRLFRDATAAALEACSVSAAGRVTSAWQELASNWADKQGPDSAVAGSSDVTGKLAQMFLRSLAELFQLEQRAVESIVHAAVAAHTRARLLDAVAAVKQVGGLTYTTCSYNAAAACSPRDQGESLDFSAKHETMFC